MNNRPVMSNLSKKTTTNKSTKHLSSQKIQTVIDQYFSKNILTEEQIKIVNEQHFKIEKYENALLVYASATGDVKLLEKSIVQGADVNTHNHMDTTPLLVAAKNGHLEIIKILHENYKVDIFQAEKSNWTSLVLAAQNGHKQILEYLFTNCNVELDYANGTESALMHACEKNQLEIVKYLVEKGADINQQCHYQETPLITAVRANCTEIAIYLLQQGAEVNVEDWNDKIALNYAINNFNIGLVELLLTHHSNLPTQAEYDDFILNARFLNDQEALNNAHQIYDILNDYEHQEEEAIEIAGDINYYAAPAA